MDVRKVGIWMVVLGGAALGLGVVVDAVQHADDPTLAAREGVFDLARFPHALFFGGISVAVLGVLALAVGSQIYASTARATVRRRLMQVGAPLLAVGLIAGSAAAASNSSLGSPRATGDSATGADEASSVDGAAHDHDHGDAAAATGDHAHDAAAATGDHAHDDAAGDHGHGSTDAATVAFGEVIPGTADGDSPCEIASPTPASPGQVGSGEAGSAEEVGEHGHRGIVKQYPLTREERRQLEEQMRQARTVVDRFPTVADAEAAGYRMSTVYVPCIGAHYTNTGLVFGFDPAAPSELLYDGTAPDARLVGLSYLVYSPGGPPEGFAGRNDHWHQHNANGGLCFGGGGVVIGGEALSEQECQARGGRKRELTDIWMVHAWVVPGFECSWGVLAGECPELGGRAGGTAWDDPDPTAGI